MLNQPIMTFSVDELEEITGIDFPASVDDMRSYVQPGGMDSLVALRFSLAPDDLDTFVRSLEYPSLLEPVTFVPGIFDTTSDQIEGWPNLAQWDALAQADPPQLLGVQEDQPGFGRYLIIDQTDPQKYVLYIMLVED